MQYGQGITASTIKIGVSAPLSGAFGFAGNEIVGTLNAYAKWSNAHGGISGRKIQVVAYDDGALDPAKDLANVERLWTVDHVFAIYGLFTDSYASYIRQHGIPAFTLGLTGPAFAAQNPTIFPVNGNYIDFNDEFVYAIESIFHYHPATVAIQYDTTIDPGQQYVSDFQKAWQSYGVKVVSTDVVNLTDADCTSAVQKWRSEGAQWVQFMGLGYVLCVPAMERAGWKPSVGMDAWASSVAGLADQLGPYVDGLVTAWEGNRLTDGAPMGMNPEIKDAQTAIATYEPSLNNGDDLDSPVTRSNWVMMELISDWAAQERTNFTQQSLVKWVQGLKNFASGVDPPILSEAPGCKVGTGTLALGRWHYNASTNKAYRNPETNFIGPNNTPYIANLQNNNPCYVTQVASQKSG